MSKAIVITQTGGPEVLQYQDVPVTKPRKGEVQIGVRAIGVNFIDIYQRSGLYAVPMPFIPGGEMCGEVIALGAGVTDFKIGDRVATATAGKGCYAETVNVPA